MRILQFIASTLLMISVLLSSTGLHLSQHWCGGSLVNASLFGEAKGCSHYQVPEKPACPMHAKSATKKKCCDQREIIIEGNDYDFEVLAMGSIEVPTVLLATLHSFWNTYLPETTTLPQKYRNHSPPLIGSDICVRIQSFLL